MARITVEDCIDKFDSRFELVLVASNRARKLHSGEEPTVERDNDKNTVIALREIADETISAEEFKQHLVEEYQTISPIDEDELGLEFNEDNIDNEMYSEKEPAVSENTAPIFLFGVIRFFILLFDMANSISPSSRFKIFKIIFARVLLPLPDSPIIPSVFPLNKFNDTSFNAFLVFPELEYDLQKPLILNTFSFFIFVVFSEWFLWLTLLPTWYGCPCF